MRGLFRLWKTGGTDLRLLWALLRNPARPVWLIPTTVVLLVFAFDPFNFALPFIGLIDDVILLPLLLRWLVRVASSSQRGTAIVPPLRDTH